VLEGEKKTAAAARNFKLAAELSRDLKDMKELRSSLAESMEGELKEELDVLRRIVESFQRAYESSLENVKRDEEVLGRNMLKGMTTRIVEMNRINSSLEGGEAAQSNSISSSSSNSSSVGKAGSRILQCEINFASQGAKELANKYNIDWDELQLQQQNNSTGENSKHEGKEEEDEVTTTNSEQAIEQHQEEEGAVQIVELILDDMVQGVVKNIVVNDGENEKENEEEEGISEEENLEDSKEVEDAREAVLTRIVELDVLITEAVENEDFDEASSLDEQLQELKKELE
jgi:hypothetical protein